MSPVARASFFVAVALAFLAACSAADDPRPERQAGGQHARGKVERLPTFVMPDLFANEESTEVGPLELDGKTGCLTWEGNPAAFPAGSEVTNDGSIHFPDGQDLAWWTDAPFFQTTARARDISSIDGLQECLHGGAGPHTVVLITGIPDPEQS